ncbi:MAG: aldehyde dehydrogenase family protein [Phycisphaerales bacterium]|nr:aldehyde dehydrogenase family protein [Phycisphaerales bacterium]
MPAIDPFAVFARLGLADHHRLRPPDRARPGDILSHNPATGLPVAAVTPDDEASTLATIARAHDAHLHWRRLPAPVRGEIVRRIGEAFRRHKADLAALVTLEAGKITQEGLGEVQECIDIADYAVGLSRQLAGLTMPSERPLHRMMEQWHPLGAVGVITAFNFPVAVWAWNAMLAAVCGDTVLWKPSALTPLTALAATGVAHAVLREQDLFRPPADVRPESIFQLAIGPDDTVGRAVVNDRRLPLISATGSCRMGRAVAQQVAARLGRCLLELGGNNAVILLPDADPDLACRAIVFGAVGTAGQRCTTTRRLIAVGDAFDRLRPRLLAAYATVRIGDPSDPGTLMGPLISASARQQMRRAVEAASAQGGTVLHGGLPGLQRLQSRPGHFVEPTIIEMPLTPDGRNPDIVREETFAPILYIVRARSLEHAIALQNDVPQGLSSAIFTDSLRAAESFLGPEGSDCGIANVNLGTSGAEIGGAFGGEKDTGGGRESGSDSWKHYMRRQTNTINYGRELPLAQGIVFA